jgi:hypothetical protein
MYSAGTRQLLNVVQPNIGFQGSVCARNYRCLSMEQYLEQRLDYDRYRIIFGENAIEEPVLMN